MKPVTKLLALALLVLPSSLYAQIRLPSVLSDHAVLQRDRPARIWGSAQPGETVKVAIHSQQMSTKAGPGGYWEVFLKPEAAGGPFELSVEGSSNIKLTDVMFGDVYIASGQSNMGFSFAGVNGFVMPHAKEVLAAASDPNLRLLIVPKEVGSTPQDDQPSKWARSTPETAARFALIGYLAARAISDQEHVPVGVIESAYGGTPLESWVSTAALAAVPGLQPKLAEWKSQIDDVPSGDMPDSMRAARRAAGNNAPAIPKPAPGHHPSNWAAGSLYNAMIAPITRYTARGVIWYQGESSSEPSRAPAYADVLRAMILDWRKQWSEPDLAFIVVQISRFGAPAAQSWGTVRDAERRALTLPNTALAVTYDLGIESNPHYPNKQPAADRVVLAARALIYKEKVEASGPLFEQATPEAGAMRVRFTHADHLQTLPGTGAALLGFEVAGQDGKFVPATTKVDKDDVLVSSPAVPAPVYVRYAWANFTDANLANAAGLPAPAFTSAPNGR